MLIKCNMLVHVRAINIPTSCTCEPRGVFSRSFVRFTNIFCILIRGESYIFKCLRFIRTRNSLPNHNNRFLAVLSIITSKQIVTCNMTSTLKTISRRKKGFRTIYLKARSATTHHRIIRTPKDIIVNSLDANGRTAPWGIYELI